MNVWFIYETTKWVFAGITVFLYITFCAIYTTIVERRRIIRELNEH